MGITFAEALSSYDMIFTTGRSYEDTHGMNTPVLVVTTIFFMGSAFVTGLMHEEASKSIPRFFR